MGSAQQQILITVDNMLKFSPGNKFHVLWVDVTTLKVTKAIRKFRPQEFQVLVDSIKTYGLFEPIKCEGLTVIDGILRLEAVKHLGWEYIPTVGEIR